jgi:MFS superfamily sulfate permease-like transporter
MEDTLKKDILAGFSVALVALPLSIGIAIASGAPASSGIIAAIIGGILGSWLGGCNISINGPAAGLIVIVLSAIHELGFQGMLAAAIIGGLIQIIFGYFKLAKKCLSFPSSVIHGMMAAIGLIIIAKQVHVILGYSPHGMNPLMLFAEIPEAVSKLNPTIAVIGFMSLIGITLYSKSSNILMKKVPAALIFVIVGAIFAIYLSIPKQYLLNIPSNLNEWIVFPDFSVMGSIAFWKIAFTLAIVGSLETTLSAAAVDKLDEQNRKSNLDKDLMSKGICNVLSGLIGGIPMITEVVRSSANASYGAQSWKSNLVHGFIILVATVSIPNALSFIPLCVLAAILVTVGYRLCKPSHFMEAKKVGIDHFIGFITTLSVTLAVDLLMGIIAGVVVQYLVELFLGLKIKNTFHSEFNVKEEDHNQVVCVQSSLTFCNFNNLDKSICKAMNSCQCVKLELNSCKYIDHSVMEQLHEIQAFYKKENKVLEMVMSPDHRSLGKDSLSSMRKVR